MTFHIELFTTFFFLWHCSFFFIVFAFVCFFFFAFCNDGTIEINNKCTYTLNIYASEPSKIGNKSANKQIAGLLSLSKTGNNDENKMDGANSNINLNFKNKSNGKGQDEMSNDKEDRRRRLKTNDNDNSIGDIKGNDNNNNNNNNNHAISNGNNSNNKNRTKKSLMDHGSDNNRSTRGDGKKLDIKDGNSVLSILNLKPDKHRDSSQDYKPVYSCIRSVVCHRTNTSFYASRGTQKLGYCTWCRQLRSGNQKQGSTCLNCGERLTAKYHRCYPELVQLQLDKQRTPELHTQYKQIIIFEKYGIIWDDEKGLSNLTLGTNAGLFN